MNELKRNTKCLSLLSSFVYSQWVSRFVLRPSSGVSCRTREPTQTLELNLLFNPQGILF